MRWLDGNIDSMVMSLSKHQEMVKDGEAWHASVHAAERLGRDLDTGQQQLWTERLFSLRPYRLKS